MAKREVVHPKLFMRVNGERKHLAPGTLVDLTDEQVERLGKKVAIPGSTKVVTADVELDLDANDE